MKLLPLLLLAASFVLADSRMKVRYTINGETTEMVVFSKAPRQRMEYTATTVIQQPDQNRFLQVEPKSKTYMVVPIPAAPAAPAAPASVLGSAPKRGSVVIVNVNTVDTGETKKILGRDARHFRTTTVHQPMPNACDSSARSVEIDGWYVTLPASQTPPPAAAPAALPTCTDEIQTQSNGPENTGFPVAYTMITKEGSKTVTTSTTTMEVLELATTALNQNLFEAPAGYELAVDLPAFSKRQAFAATAAAPAKAAGTMRIGVLEMADNSGHKLNPEFLTAQVSQSLTAAKMEPLRVQDAEQARAINCDYVLVAEVVSIKKNVISQAAGKAAKMTGMVRGLVRTSPAPAAPAPVDEDQVEATITYKLTPLKDGLNPLNGTVIAKGGALISLKTAMALASNVSPMLAMAQMYSGMSNLASLSNMLTAQQTATQSRDSAFGGMQSWNMAATSLAASQAPLPSDGKAVTAGLQAIAKALAPQ